MLKPIPAEVDCRHWLGLNYPDAECLHWFPHVAGDRLDQTEPKLTIELASERPSESLIDLGEVA